MEKRISVSITMTPEDIEHEVWNMDSKQQAVLLLMFARRRHYEGGAVAMQLQAVRDSIRECMDEEQAMDVERFVEAVLDYVKEATR